MTVLILTSGRAFGSYCTLYCSIILIRCVLVLYLYTVREKLLLCCAITVDAILIVLRKCIGIYAVRRKSDDPRDEIRTPSSSGVVKNILFDGG